MCCAGLVDLRSRVSCQAPESESPSAPAGEYKEKESDEAREGVGEEPSTRTLYFLEDHYISPPFYLDPLVS